MPKVKRKTGRSGRPPSSSEDEGEGDHSASTSATDKPLRRSKRRRRPTTGEDEGESSPSTGPTETVLRRSKRATLKPRKLTPAPLPLRQPVRYQRQAPTLNLVRYQASLRFARRTMRNVGHPRQTPFAGRPPTRRLIRDRDWSRGTRHRPDVEADRDQYRLQEFSIYGRHGRAANRPYPWRYCQKTVACRCGARKLSMSVTYMTKQHKLECPDWAPTATAPRRFDFIRAYDPPPMGALPRYSNDRYVRCDACWAAWPFTMQRNGDVLRRYMMRAHKSCKRR